MNPLLCPCVPFVDMQISAADGCYLYFDENICRANLRPRHLTQLRTGSRLRLHDGLHCFWHAILLLSCHQFTKTDFITETPRHGENQRGTEKSTTNHRGHRGGKSKISLPFVSSMFLCVLHGSIPCPFFGPSCFRDEIGFDGKLFSLSLE